MAILGGAEVLSLPGVLLGLPALVADGPHGVPELLGDGTLVVDHALHVHQLLLDVRGRPLALGFVKERGTETVTVFLQVHQLLLLGRLGLLPRQHHVVGNHGRHSSLDLGRESPRGHRKLEGGLAQIGRGRLDCDLLRGVHAAAPARALVAPPLLEDAGPLLGGRLHRMRDHLISLARVASLVEGLG